MQLVDALEAIRLEQPSTTTIGVFDGVHIGHQYLIKQLVANAHAQNRLAVVVSFFPHPDVVLGQVSGRYYLTTREEKARQMELLGVDVLVVHEFSEQVRTMRALTFVGRLMRHLSMVDLWATSDFALGYKREGNLAFLEKQGQQRGFSVSTIDHLAPDTVTERVSSTNIRGALAEGDIMTANRWLGRPYRVSGEVTHGAGRGQTIGFPTANLQTWDELILPAPGVYACFAHVEGQRHQAVTNVGYRPTFDGQDITVEAHLLDFEQSLYDKVVDLDFVAHLRGEQKFSGVEALVAQIGADVEQARGVLASLA